MGRATLSGELLQLLADASLHQELKLSVTPSGHGGLGETTTTLLDEASARLSGIAADASSLSEDFARWLAVSEARMERLERENTRNRHGLAIWRENRDG